MNLRRIFPTLAIFAFYISTFATADEDRDIKFVFPVTPNFSTASGVVYPGPGAAGALNPASLTTLPNTWGVYTANSIPSGNAGDYGVYASVARTNRFFGFSAGYSGTVGSATTHGYFAGMGFRLDRISLGASVMKSPVPAGASMRADLVIMLPMVRNMHFAAKLEDAATAQRPVMGVGYRGKVSQLEANFRLPPLNDMTAGYESILSTTTLLGSYSFHAAASLQTASKRTDYTFGIGKWLEASIHLSLQYSSNNRLNLAFCMEL